MTCFYNCHSFANFQDLKKEQNCNKSQWGLRDIVSPLSFVASRNDRELNILCPKVLTPLCSSMVTKRGDGVCVGTGFHHDNARPHTSRMTTEFLQEKGLFVVPHPPNSPDIVPNDFWAFPYLKKQLEKRCFQTVQGMAKAVRDVFHPVPPEQYEKVISKWTGHTVFAGLLKRMGSTSNAHGSLVLCKGQIH